MSRAVLVAAARRLLVMFCVTTSVTVLVSLGAGAIAGAGAMRSVSVGLYLGGSFLIIAGFFFGNRGPARPKGAGGELLLGPRDVRWATLQEREEAINDSAIFVLLGLVLILLGVIVDSRIALV